MKSVWKQERKANAKKRKEFQRNADSITLLCSESKEKAKHKKEDKQEGEKQGAP